MINISTGSDDLSRQLETAISISGSRSPPTSLAILPMLRNSAHTMKNLRVIHLLVFVRKSQIPVWIEQVLQQMGVCHKS